VIEQGDGNEFAGHFKWSNYGSFEGTEQFSGRYIKETRELEFQGTKFTPKDRYSNDRGTHFYKAKLSSDGTRITDGEAKGYVWKGIHEDAIEKPKLPEKYVLNPRPRAKQDGRDKTLYIDRVNIEDGKFYIFFTGAPAGNGGDGDYGAFWNNLSSVTLTGLDDSKTWKPKGKGEDENFTKVTTGFYLMFEGVSGTRFSLKGANNSVFEEITIP
jgi:hypothetical protein